MLPEHSEWPEFSVNDEDKYMYLLHLKNVLVMLSRFHALYKGSLFALSNLTVLYASSFNTI